MADLLPIQVRTLAGLETCLAEELTALGARDVRPDHRLVDCRGDLALLYRANLWCRTAIRVLRPIAGFPAADEQALYDGVRAIDWRPWLAPDGSLAIDAHVHSSFTTHSLFVAQLTKDAIVDRFRETTGERPSVNLDEPDLRLAVSLFENRIELFVDSSGESLHKRGYRLKTGEAPLSETLAAGIVKLSGWDGKTPLVDPMCGSGTIVIEAGLIAANLAPGLLRRRFGFQSWADYDRPLYERLVEEARAAAHPEPSAPIVGVELDPAVGAIARENVARAGLQKWVRIETGDFFQWDRLPQPPGLVLVNPPYDERLTVDNVADLYRRLGDRFKQAYAGWTAWILTGNRDAMKFFGLRSSRRIPLYNGQIECRLMRYELSAGGAPKRDRLSGIHPKWKAQAEVFANRVLKNLKHYGKWAKREGISAWRVYDWDIPELPFTLDVFGERAQLVEIERNHDRSPAEQAGYLQLIADTASTALEKPVHLRRTKKAKSAEPSGEYFEIEEAGLKYLVNLDDYSDAGLALVHRKARALVRQEAAGKDFLELYAQTGAFTVCAAAGGAKSTTSVDTSSTALDWAADNLRRNGFERGRHELIRADVLEYLEGEESEFDLAVVDPPARSINRATGQTFDTQEHHVFLLTQVLAHLRPGGSAIFSTSYRNFRLDEAKLKGNVTELTKALLPPDFERKPRHRVWRIMKGA